MARACVITDLSEAKSIQHGDILITHCTDIGWSPYFPLLGGIVTELGGLISHGAVVAREYGLPCIVGAKHATHVFHTGNKHSCSLYVLRQTQMKLYLLDYLYFYKRISLYHCTLISIL